MKQLPTTPNLLYSEISKMALDKVKHMKVKIGKYKINLSEEELQNPKEMYVQITMTDKTEVSNKEPNTESFYIKASNCLDIQSEIVLYNLQLSLAVNSVISELISQVTFDARDYLLKNRVSYELGYCNVLYFPITVSYTSTG